MTPHIKARIYRALKIDFRYYITAAPQCPYPDVYIGTALNQASFDAVYVQFCESAYTRLENILRSPLDNNYCGLDQPSVCRCPICVPSPRVDNSV